MPVGHRTPRCPVNGAEPTVARKDKRFVVVTKVIIWAVRKFWISIFVTSVFIVLSGCGGSDSASPNSNGVVGGASLSQFEATLPDGSVMELEILANDNLIWDGEYAVATETGPYAHQVGDFVGTISGSNVSMDCSNNDGSSFTMTGTSAGNKGFQLTRSDIPGVVLNFTPVTPPSSPKSRADVSFNLNVNSSSGRCTISDQYYSTNTAMTEYRGTWLGCKVTFWSYASGYAAIVIYVNDYAIDNVTLSTYRLSDFSTVTKPASSGRVTAYNPTSRTNINFGSGASVSP